MILSVVVHCMLFCAHGTQPWMPPSHLILRTWGVVSLDVVIQSGAAGTLQRSQAWPVRVDFSSLFFTTLV